MSLEKYPQERCSLVNSPSFQKRDGTGCCQEVPRDGEIPPVNSYLLPASGSGGDVGLPYAPLFPSLQTTPVPVIGNIRVHRFWLRENFEVEINLPVDLTRDEMQRLQEFVGLFPVK